jgi:hypothetical protein
MGWKAMRMRQWRAQYALDVGQRSQVFGTR